ATRWFHPSSLLDKEIVVVVSESGGREGGELKGADGDPTLASCLYIAKNRNRGADEKGGAVRVCRRRKKTRHRGDSGTEERAAGGSFVLPSRITCRKSNDFARTTASIDD
ncbi:unnamed protein product, partial [Scytosiphon promiscuus]